ncbi:MAG: molybdopterin cofactor-binding domain-containing protein [Burkholderiaceae bacterium]
METTQSRPGAFRAPRRRFLKGSAAAGGGLAIGFALPVASRLAMAATDATINAYLKISPRNRITVVCGLSEMGQGVLTAIPMLVAEELDVDWSQVGVEQAGVDKAYANPVFGMQATGGSTSVRGHWQPMRMAGAAAREMLLAAAAKAWGAKPSDCHTEHGAVVHRSGRRLSYGELAAAAAAEPVPASPKLKDAKDFRILGTPAKRLDTPAKIDGSARFGIDVRLPGMLVAVLERAPVIGASAKTVDDTAARQVPGVREIVRIPDGVAVLADGYWAAKKGRDALKVSWDLGKNATLSSETIARQLAEATQRSGATARNEGKADEAQGAKTLDALYEAPYLAHACMEPMNCTAWVRKDEVEIWAGTQSQGPAQGILGQVASVAPTKVKINTLFLGGGFGRRFAPDFTIAATVLSKQVGRPVKLVYSREDDMRAYFYRPAAAARFAATLDDTGKAIALRANVASPSIMAGSGFMKIAENGVDHFAVEGIADNPYDIANMKVGYVREEPGVQVWFWRSVGHSQNAFFMESFVDEMAAAAGRDPFEFRRAMLGKAPRHRAVLELAAAKADWGKPLPAGRHRGIALAKSFGSFVSEVAEVSVAEDGTPRIHRIVAAIDCGAIVNPEIIRRQVESAIVYGLTAMLYGRISFRDGRVEQGNFDTYRMLRMPEMPKVEVHIVKSDEAPGGVGEPGLPPAAPAVANAIFAATGKRIRSLPLDPGMLKRA